MGRVVPSSVGICLARRGIRPSIWEATLPYWLGWHPSVHTTSISVRPLLSLCRPAGRPSPSIVSRTALRSIRSSFLGGRDDSCPSYCFWSPLILIVGWSGLRLRCILWSAGERSSCIRSLRWSISVPGTCWRSHRRVRPDCRRSIQCYAPSRPRRPIIIFVERARAPFEHFPRRGLRCHRVCVRRRSTRRIRAEIPAHPLPVTLGARTESRICGWSQAMKSCKATLLLELLIDIYVTMRFEADIAACGFLDSRRANFFGALQKSLHTLCSYSTTKHVAQSPKSRRTGPFQGRVQGESAYSSPCWMRYTDNGHSVTFHLVLSPSEPVLMCSTCPGLRRPSFEISRL